MQGPAAEWRRLSGLKWRTLPGTERRRFRTLTDPGRIFDFCWLQLDSEDEAVLDTLSDRWQTQKDPRAALDFKQRGNARFKARDYVQAVALYSKGISHSAPDTHEAALLYANRSAALHHLQRHQECLADIGRAQQHGYPPELEHKVLARRAACLHNLGVPEAGGHVRSRVTLGDGRKPSPLPTASPRNPADSDPRREAVDHGEDGEPWGVAASIALHSDAFRGRHLVASEDIRPGEVVLQEEAFAAVLISEGRSRAALPSEDCYCHHCLGQAWLPLPCLGCSFSSYCSELCRGQAWEQYHRLECPLGGLLLTLGSFTHLALRTVLVAGIREVERAEQGASEKWGQRESSNHKPRAGGGSGEESDRKLWNNQSRYLTIHGLLTHTERQQPEHRFLCGLTAAAVCREIRRKGLEPLAVGDWPELDTGSGEGPELDTGNGEGPELEAGSGEGPELDAGSGEGPELEAGSGEGLELDTCSGEGPELDTCSGEGPELDTCSGEGPELDAGSGEGPELDTCSGEGPELDTGSGEGPELDTGSGEGPELDAGSGEGRKLRVLGVALLRHVLQLGCNAHAITALRDTGVGNSQVVGREQVRIATAVYSRVSLLNHSCDPNTSITFHNTTITVRASRLIPAGHEVLHCYGPHRSRMVVKERQQALRAQYFFQCRCTACIREEETGAGPNSLLDQFLCSRCGATLQESDETHYTCSNSPCGHRVSKQCLFQQVEEIKCQLGVASALINGQPDEALRQLSKCEREARRRLSDQHRLRGEIEDRLAQLYAAQGDWTAAARHLGKSMVLVESQYGNGSVELGNELFKLAQILFNGCAVAEALSVIEEAERLLSVHWGPDHRTVMELSEMKSCLLTLPSQSAASR